MEFKNRNDYSFSAFKGNQFLYKKDYSDNIYRDCLWLSASTNFSDWEYVNVYARRTGRYIGRYYRNSFIPQKPR